MCIMFISQGDGKIDFINSKKKKKVPQIRNSRMHFDRGAFRTHDL